MAWTLIDVADLAPGVKANASVWQSLCDNHDELYSTYVPSILDNPVDWTETNTSATDRLQFRIRGNSDLEDVRLRARCKVGVSGDQGTFTLTVGSQSNTVNVTSTSWGWVTCDVTPTESGAVDCQIQTEVASAAGPDPDTLEVDHVQVFIVGAASAAAAQPSGFTPITTQAYASNEPISSERVQRLLNGPRSLATDRPYCLFRHVADEQVAYGSKAPRNWSMTASTSNNRVARFRVPPGDRIARQYVIDAYLDESGSGATGELQIGNQKWEMTWADAVGGWLSYGILTLPPTYADGSLVIKPGAGNSAAVRSLQIWRIA